MKRLQDFKVGKYYFYKGTEQSSWVKQMSFMLDGKAHKCLSINLIEERILFEGCLDKNFANSAWYWEDYSQFYEYNINLDMLIEQLNKE